MSKEEMKKQVEAMEPEVFCEMMDNKVQMRFTVQELMELYSALETYLETPEGLISELMDNAVSKLQRRLDSKIIIRLGTYGIFMDDLEEE